MQLALLIANMPVLDVTESASPQAVQLTTVRYWGSDPKNSLRDSARLNM